MSAPPFNPVIDLPLVLATVCLLFWYYKHWAQSHELSTSTNLAERLPAARMRVCTLFAAVLILCWLADLAVWSLFAVVLGFNLVFAMTLGDEAGHFGLLAVVYLIREWSFGFPEMVLQPPELASVSPETKAPTGPLMGKTGVTKTPLCPSGQAEFNGTSVSVTSANNRMIDANTDVIVTAYRNGKPCVLPHPDQ